MYLGDLMDFFVQRNYKVRTYPMQKCRLKPQRGGVWPNSPTALRSDDWPSLVNCHLQAVICILFFLQQMFSCGVEAKKAEHILLTIILSFCHDEGSSCLLIIRPDCPSICSEEEKRCQQPGVAVDHRRWAFYFTASVEKLSISKRRMLVMFCMTGKGDWNEQNHFAESNLVLSYLLFHCLFWLMFASFRNRNVCSAVSGETKQKLWHTKFGKKTKKTKTYLSHKVIFQ